ncbi:MAG: thiol:disulfide interchange protein DsbA/DsbL [Magnetococcales bacterium]|nr:thiol:disulfide interchange protein DsbA/DsbL [Magnetococcales bacterium]
MLTRRIFLAGLILPLLPGTLARAEPFLPKDGVHYETIPSPVPPAAPGPEVVEVFNFKCPHCYDFHPHMTAWSLKMKDRYAIRSLPIAFSSQSDLPVRAYHAAAFMGRGEEMKHAIFKGHFEEGVNIDSPGELIALAEGLKLDAARFKDNLNGFAVNGKIAQGRGQANAYGIKSTPTLVINGRYRVSPGKHDGHDTRRLFVIVESLTAQ